MLSPLDGSLARFGFDPAHQPERREMFAAA